MHKGYYNRVYYRTGKVTIIKRKGGGLQRVMENISIGIIVILSSISADILKTPN